MPVRTIFNQTGAAWPLSAPTVSAPAPFVVLQESWRPFSGVARRENSGSLLSAELRIINPDLANELGSLSVSTWVTSVVLPFVAAESKLNVSPPPSMSPAPLTV